MKDNTIIDLVMPSESTRDNAKKDPWVSFARCILTTVDKDIILKGMVLAVLIQYN